MRQGKPFSARLPLDIDSEIRAQAEEEKRPIASIVVERLRAAKFGEQLTEIIKRLERIERRLRK